MHELFLKECKMIGRSLVYFIFIGVMTAFYFTQFFQEIPASETPQKTLTTAKDISTVNRIALEEPVYVQDFQAYFSKYHEYPYGMVNEDIEDQVIPKAATRLLSEYNEGNYIAYPMGLIKNVKLNKTETKRIEEVLEEITGESIDDLKVMNKSGKWDEVLSGINIKYDRFKELMKEVNNIIGSGSNYSNESLARLGTRPKTYEEAMKEYNDLIKVDKITNGYARLFSDYLGIALGLFPVFLVVFYMMRDRKSGMQQLIYYREIFSFKLIMCRYLALISMMMLPVLVLAVISTISFMGIGRELKVSIDYLAFIKYSFGWLMPTIMAVTALGIFITVLTESVLAIIIQVVWFFMSIFSAGLEGNYHITQLIIRFNSSGDREVFVSNINNILFNRLFYISFSAVLLAASVYILNLRRLGRIDIHVKFRKYSSTIQSKYKGGFSE